MYSVEWGGLYSSVTEKPDYKYEELPEKTRTLFLKLRKIENCIDYQRAWEIACSISEDDANYLNSPFLDELRKKERVGNVEVFKFIYARGGAIVEQNNKFLFLYQASLEHFDLTKYLYEKHKSELTFHDLSSIISCCSWCAPVSIVEFLLEAAGALQKFCIHFFDYALEKACKYGNFEVVKCLVEHMDKTNTRFPDDLLEKVCTGNNPIEKNKKINYDQTVKYLVEHGAKVSKDAILTACKKNSPEIVLFLLKKGVDIHVYKNWPLRWASGNNHLDLVKYLVEHGADIRVFNNESLQLASGNGHLEIVKYLVEHGADVHANNDLALQKASARGHLEVVKYLVEHGADIHANNDEPLRMASYRDHLEIVKYLVEHGANVHTNEDEPLRTASENGRLNLVKYLVEHGADIHVWDDEPVRSACYKGYLETVKYLLDNGADLHVSTRITG